VFLTLELTEIILFIGTIRLGGYVGIPTALVAWYASAAG
jgi:succinate-acetate transporter protein